MNVSAVLEAVDDGCILRKRKMKNLSAVRVSIRASPSTCSPLPLLRFIPFRLELETQLEGERTGCLCPD